MNEEGLKKYQQQVTEILSRDYFPEPDFQIDTPIVRKNNNIQKYGITIKAKDSNVAPTFYIEDFVKEGYEPEAAAQSLYRVFIEQEAQFIQQNAINQLTDFDKCKDKICYRIVNKQKNLDIVDNCPTIPIAPDLMIVFYIQVQKDATCLIHNDLVKTWGLVDDVEKSLFEIADNNTEQLHPVSFQSIAAVMRELVPEGLWDEMELDLPMYVLSNNDRCHGASTILYRNGRQLKDCLDEIRMKYRVNDVYIIPSSIHECLLVPALPNITKERLQEICQEVNQTQVQDIEFLSDNIFSFNENEGFQQITFTYRNMQQSR